MRQRTRFAEVSTLVPRGAGLFDGTADAEWTIGGKPNGGYLLSMLCRAATSVSAHRHVLAASAHFLHSPSPGPVRVEAEVLRTGRSASQIRARMSQEDRPCVEALVTAGELDPDAAPYWDRGAPRPDGAAYEDCERLTPQFPSGARVAILEQAEVRLEPGSAGFTSGRPNGRGELRGWLALPDGEPFDPVSLVYAADAFPPATFDIEFSGWMPTLELTVYVRALPAPGPVRVLFRAQLIDGQRVDEECTVWDRTGRLVAQGHQLAGIRLPRLPGQRQRPGWHRRGVHDGRRGPPVRGEQVEDRLEFVDGPQPDLHEVAVLAGDPVALGHVRHLTRYAGDQPQPSADRADPHDRADRVPESARVDVGAVGQDPGLLQPPQPVGDGGTRQPDPPGQFGDPQPRRGLQLGQDPAVDRVQRDRSR